MSQSPEALVERIAGGQAGCVSRSQALATGFSDDKIAHRVKTHRWRRTHRGVYILAAAGHSWLQDVWGALLATSPRSTVIRDVVVTHETALLLHGMDPARLPRYPVTLTVPNGAHRRISGTIIHQKDDLAPHHLTEVCGLPVSRPARAIVDLAAKIEERRLGHLLDEVIVARLATQADVSTCLADIARHGKPGLAKLGSVLDERGPGHVPPQSELERRLFEALAAAGLPEPVRQFSLPGRGELHELVDCAYVDAKMLVEADGRRWHTRIRDLQRDHRRDAHASRAGWLTLRFTYEEIATAPRDVASTVDEVRSVRLAQLCPSTA